MRRINRFIFLVVITTTLLLGCSPATDVIEPVVKRDVIIIDSHDHIYLNCEKVELASLRSMFEVDYEAPLILVGASFTSVNVFTQVLDITREVRSSNNIIATDFPYEDINEATCPDVELQLSQKRKTDAAYEKALIGVWSAHYEKEDYRLYGETRYNLDGTAVGKGEQCGADGCDSIEFTSTWRVTDGVLISTTLSSNNDTPPGTTYTDRIDSITFATLVMYEVETGTKQVRNKVRTPKFLTD